MNILVTICARGGSKGIPGKNIKPVNGIPLIGYSILVAKKFAEKYKADIAVSTDSDEIKNAVKPFGIDTEYTRPAELATDTAGKVGVIKHVREFFQKRTSKVYDLLLDLDVTSPLRTLEDLEEAMKIMLHDKECLSLFSVSPPRRNPYFNMVEEGNAGYYKVVKKLEGTVLTRQSAPKVFDMNASFYFYSAEFFNQNCPSAITERSRVYIVPHICFDLDEPEDYEYLEYMIDKKKWSF
jgi:CMP-N,N'-diacetyllegionaminic acid synthase